MNQDEAHELGRVIAYSLHIVTMRLETAYDVEDYEVIASQLKGAVRVVERVVKDLKV